MFIFLTSVNESATDSDRLEELLKLIGDGDKDALAEAYNLAKSSVYGFALSILKNSHDAEDALQNVFISVWSGAQGYRANGKPMAWILTITKNLCYMKLRQNRKTAELEPEHWELTPSDDDTAEVALNKAFLTEALAVLNGDERQIIMLHAVSGLKFREIAALLDTVTATVLSKYHRAIKKLQNYAKEDI